MVPAVAVKDGWRNGGHAVLSRQSVGRINVRFIADPFVSHHLKIGAGARQGRKTGRFHQFGKKISFGLIKFRQLQIMVLVLHDIGIGQLDGSIGSKGQELMDFAELFIEHFKTR